MQAAGDVAAFPLKAVLLRVVPGARLARPIHVVFVTSGVFLALQDRLTGHSH